MHVPWTGPDTCRWEAGKTGYHKGEFNLNLYATICHCINEKVEVNHILKCLK